MIRIPNTDYTLYCWLVIETDRLLNHVLLSVGVL